MGIKLSTFVVFMFVAVDALGGAVETIEATTKLETAWSKDVPCAVSSDGEGGCKPSRCRRKIVDGLFSDDEINRLLSISERAFALRDAEPSGGPSIFDLNTGFIRDSKGLDNVFFSRNLDLFSEEDFRIYGQIIHKLKSKVQEYLQVPKKRIDMDARTALYFTAPTFVTRLDGRNDSWEPAEIHDEYWHLHVDKNSTSHYDYSGLLYLSTQDVDFTGGRLRFFARDEVTVEEVVEPRRGRALFFTSGPENPHGVDRVLTGTRFVLSFWFTCDPRREFQIFLDGKAHKTFGQQYVAKFQQQHSRSRSGEL